MNLLSMTRLRLICIFRIISFLTEQGQSFTKLAFVTLFYGPELVCGTIEILQQFIGIFLLLVDL